MEPSIRGQLVHEVQARLMTGLQSSGQLPVTAENLESAVTLMNGILTDAAARLREEVAPAIPQVWESGVASVRADLTGYLHHIAANETEWTPIEFEKKFDTTILDRYKINGQIDLIERHTTGALRVTDHKTGAFPLDPPRTTGGGEALQPLLYALAAEQLLGELPAEARLFYSTLKGNYKPARMAVDRDAARKLLDTMEAWIERPFLPASPRPEGCVRCEYAPVCGPYEELRVARKPAIDIRGLAEIRKTP
jgi:RecB family exonuclease